MEIALSIKSFSYYSTSETVYISGTVFKKIDLERPENLECYFREVRKNSKINLRVQFSKPEEILVLLAEKIVKVKSTEIIKPTEPTRCITFIAESVKPCEI